MRRPPSGSGASKRRAWMALPNQRGKMGLGQWRLRKVGEGEKETKAATSPPSSSGCSSPPRSTSTRRNRAFVAASTGVARGGVGPRCNAHQQRQGGLPSRRIRSSRLTFPHRARVREQGRWWASKEEARRWDGATRMGREGASGGGSEVARGGKTEVEREWERVVG